jgi:UDP-N-acetylmuramoyl-L-alanyl-D-glutamate--2,6-diaminopimelate ligase
LFRKIEPLGHLTEAVLLNTLAGGSPAKGMKVIGITGTNGKTTTSFLVHRMLHEAGFKTGLMTTVGYGAGNDIKPQTEHMTNVPVPLLIKRLKELKAQGVEWLVMETTSHALAQHRDWGLPYSVAVLTNITHEHLDYHGTFERYVQAKLQLFKRANRNKKGLKVGVVNADDPSASTFTTAIAHPLTYGVNNGEIKANKIQLANSGISYQAVVNYEVYQIKSRLPGSFNVYNTLAAVGVGRTLGLNRQQIEQGIAALEGVPGRMTSFTGKTGATVIVDFAHTPDALEKALKAVRESSKGKVILVFGATGDRDKLKRPVMGDTAAKNADQIFLTDDETYTEDSQVIIRAVYQGIVAAGGEKKTTIIQERMDAIKAALAAAKSGDTVLLAGIGHQTTRNMGGKEIPWNEIEIVQQHLQ